MTGQLKVHTDFISLDDKRVYLDVYFESSALVSGQLDLVCMHKISGMPDQKITSLSGYPISLKTGMNKFQLSLIDAGNTTMNESFLSTVRRYGIFPVGDYEITFSLTSGADTHRYTILRTVDSVLHIESPFGKKLQSSLSKSYKRHTQTEADAEAAGLKLEKLLLREGLTRQIRTENGQRFIYLYSGGWFLGKGLLGNSGKLAETIRDQKDALVQSGLETYESVFSRLKNNKTQESKEAVGQIGVSANMGTRQDAFAGQEKNFYEVQGNVELPVFDIPVSVEGYYTTQDIRRKVKSSYIRFHYDADKAKQKLMKLITGYKGEYEKVSAKGQGLDGNYKKFLQGLSGEKKNLFYQLIAQSGLKDYTSFADKEDIQQGNYTIDTARLLEALMKKTDSLGSGRDEAALQQSRDSIRIVYGKILKKYNELKALQAKYEKYNTLLSQYKNTSYFDSLLAYDKVKDLQDYENMSYKDMAKTAGSMLPEGKIKKFTTGLTNLDIGIFSKYSFKYTLGGQQVKGIDLGYDLGFATTQVTTGKTEYIGRSGEIDRYTFYSGSVRFKPVLNQQLELIYYGYSPGKRMFNENSEFFKHINTDMPTFRNPVHIFSVRHQGSFSRYLRAETEVALSDKKTQGDRDEKPGVHDRMAYSVSLEGDIPKTNISLLTTYEHTGKDFENNTLPFSFNGTDRLKVGSKLSFFRNYLHIGVEYNHLLQKNISNTYTNARWGFDIRTQGKRYPNISVSYKPFSTYRSFADTLAIPQRPMFGQVWTAKASYQFRKNKDIYRFMLMYNSAGNRMDTTEMKNEMFQFSFCYMNKRSMTSLNISKLNFTSGTQSIIPVWHYQNSYMISVSESYTVQKNIQANAGLDFGVSRFGLSAAGGHAGVSYRSPKTSLTYRLGARYTQYKLGETNSWQRVLRGTLDITWQFRYKLNDLDKTN